MTILSIFECDVCGDRHGSLNSILEVPLVIEADGEQRTFEIHTCIDHPSSEAMEVLCQIDSISGDDGAIVVDDIGGDVKRVEIGDVNVSRSDCPYGLTHLIEEEMSL